MKQRTPGTWQRHDTADYAEIKADGCDDVIAMVGRADDADLIAAAPDLLEALDTSAIVIHTLAHPNNRSLFSECVDVVCVANREAMAKARGEA